jgi:hypothetical protein
MRGIWVPRGVGSCSRRPERAVASDDLDRDDRLPRQAGPTIIAVLEGGPLAGRRLEAEVVEGRPPGTIDVQADDGSTCRYCLAEWAPADPSAVYAFLYPV